MTLRNDRKPLFAVLICAALLAFLAGAASAFAETVATAASPLSLQQLAKLQKVIDSSHSQATIDPKVAKMLGLGKPGKPVMAMQVALIDNDKSVHHVFDRLEDRSGFLIGKRSAEGFAVYRLDNDLKPVANVLWRSDGDKAALKRTDTAGLLRQELELWARFAEEQK
jgi:hypothetical protein